MVDEEDKEEDLFEKEDKFEAFTPEGEALGYISVDQARVLAIQHARENTDFYGRRYQGVELYWEVVGQEETEDYYEVRLSYRPARRFSGEPGIERFTIDKEGAPLSSVRLSASRWRAREDVGCSSPSPASWSSWAPWLASCSPRGAC